MFIKSYKRIKNKTPHTGSSTLFVNIFFTRVAKYLKDNNHKSLYYERNYPRILFLGHYLFLEPHKSPRASFSENCSHLGTDNIRRQISVHIFPPIEAVVNIATLDISTVILYSTQLNHLTPSTSLLEQISTANQDDLDE